jgi:hypothetical protein
MGASMKIPPDLDGSPWTLQTPAGLGWQPQGCNPNNILTMWMGGVKGKDEE